jgi:predicted nucleic acid-binding protein
MMTLVVDASIAPKWFVPEIHSQHASRLRAVDYRLVAPSLLSIELCSIALQKLRRGQLDEREASFLVNESARLGVELFSAEPLLSDAFRLARAYHPSVYDCLYAALAIREGCQVVTADRPFYEALERPFPGSMLWVEDIPA